MMRLIKKLFILCLIAFLFTGCSKKETQSKEIEFLTNRTDYVNGTTNAAGIADPNTAYYKILADRFEKETGIKVKLTAYNDYPNAMRRRLASNNIGDVITLPDNNFPTKTITTFFQPIGTKEQLSDYLFLDNCADGDKVYGLSASYYISGCIYNKKTFAEAGYKEFPKTLDELHDAFAKIKTAGKIPAILNRANSILGQVKIIVPSFAGDSYSLNKMWSADNPFSKNYPFGQMLFELAYWTNMGWVEPEFINDWEGSKTKVASGEAGMMFLGSWGYPQIKKRTESIKKANPDDIGFAAFPICKPYTDKQYIQAGPGNPMVISKNTKNFEACRKWIDYLINSGMEKDQGGLPIKKSMKDYDRGFDPVMNEIKEGKMTLLDSVPADAFEGDRTVQILKDMDLYADYKFIGKPLDAAKESMEAYQNCINQMNREFDSVRKSKGY